MSIRSKHIENASLIQNQIEVKDGEDVYREELKETSIIAKSFIISLIVKGVKAFTIPLRRQRAHSNAVCRGSLL